MDSLYGMNKNTYNLLIKDINKKVNYKLNNMTIINDINIFTEEHKKLIFKLLKLYIKSKCIKKVNDKTYKYIINKNDFVEFKTALDTFEVLNIDRRSLLSDERYNKCYLQSILTSSLIENSSVVIGVAQYGNYQYLHSVIEYFDEEENDFYILDWTQNLVMKEIDFIKLYNFKILNSMSNKDALHLYNLCSNYGLRFGLSPLLLFNKELTKEIENKVLKKI